MAWLARSERLLRLLADARRPVPLVPSYPQTDVPLEEDAILWAD